MAAVTNTRACGLCRHLDTRVTPMGKAYCWQTYQWSKPDAVVADCDKAERADGKGPPGRIKFEGEQN